MWISGPQWSSIKHYKYLDKGKKETKFWEFGVQSQGISHPGNKFEELRKRMNCRCPESGKSRELLGIAQKKVNGWAGIQFPQFSGAVVLVIVALLL